MEAGFDANVGLMVNVSILCSYKADAGYEEDVILNWI